MRTLIAAEDLSQPEAVFPHDGKFIVDLAAGFAITLPDATGSGRQLEFYVLTTLTGDLTIVAPDTDNVIWGLAHVATDGSGQVFPAAATDDTITLNGTTTGGVKGSWVRMVDIAANKWVATVEAVSTGAEATPFSATV
jgi:hypothetical protein